MVEVDAAVLLQMQNAITTLQGQVEELMAFKVQHVGYDVATQVGYVHPVQKITMAEFGIGTVRADETGVQFKGNSSRGIWFINPDFWPFRYAQASFGLPVGQQYAYIWSDNMFATDRADIAGRVAGQHGERVDFSYNTYSTWSSDIQLDARSTGFHSQVYIFSTPNPGGAAYVSVFPALQFSFETSDTANTGTFYEGDMLYRSDLKKLRFNDGATENVAMESWVLANTPQTFAHELMLMGG